MKSSQHNIHRSAGPHNRSRFVKIDKSDAIAVKQALRIIKMLYKVGRTTSRRWVRGNVRFSDLELALAHICKGPLPDDDFGRLLLYVLACHVWHNRRRRCSADEAVAASAAHWAPWCGAEELSLLIENVAEYPRKWDADELAVELGITIAVRDALGLTTIGGVDLDQAGRAKRRAKKSNDRRTKNRRAEGVVPRDQWLAEHSKTRSRPWVPLGMSKAKYYRLGLHQVERETGAPAANNGDQLLRADQSHLLSTPNIGMGAERIARDGAERLIDDSGEGGVNLTNGDGFRPPPCLAPSPAPA